MKRAGEREMQKELPGAAAAREPQGACHREGRDEGYPGGKAVKTVHAGGKFSPEAVKEIYQRRQMMTDLTPREREVLELVAVGLPNDEVAKRLGISYESVKVHMKHLLFKFDVHDRTELVSLAIRGGFVKDVPAK